MSKKEKKEKKEKKPMDKELGSQIVKSATAVACALAVGLTASSAVGKISDAKIAAAKALAEAAPAASQSASASESTGTDEDYVAPVTDGEAAGEETAVSEETGEEATAPEESAAPSGDTQQTAKKNDNGAPKTNAEIIAYCNKALNDAKAAKVGYTKTFVRTCDPSLPSIVTSIINQNKVTTAAKGSDKIVDDFPAGGNAWSCKLREQDVSKVEFKQNGQYYEITLRLPTEHNPGKGETSKYGRAMTVVDAADAKEMLAAVKSVDFTYHDGYVYAKIDSKTGRLVKAEFSATADLDGDIALIGKLSTKNLKSTETFTDFKY